MLNNTTIYTVMLLISSSVLTAKNDKILGCDVS